MKEDSTPKAIFTNKPPQSREDLTSKANSSPKHEENLTIRVVSMCSTHPQLARKTLAWSVFWINKLLKKVKSSHPHENASLREESTKLYKTLMIHGVDISVTRYEIYEVLDITKISHNIKIKGNNPTLVKNKELMKKAKSIKETKLSLKTMSHPVNEANMKLILVRKQFFMI